MREYQSVRSKLIHLCWDEFRSGEFIPITLDIETTIKDGSAMPQDGAEFVLGGVDDPRFGYAEHDTPKDMLQDIIIRIAESGNQSCVLVGHNIKFDLLHLMAAQHDLTATMLNASNTVGIWDTAQAEYLISAQRRVFPSLIDSCARFGIEAKEHADVHDKYFSQGKGADYVPKNLLSAYLKDDVTTTHELFMAQLTMPDATLPLACLFVQGWALVGYTRMEHNGLPILEGALDDLLKQYWNTEERLTALIEQICKQHMQFSPATGVQLTNRTYSTLFFGEPGVPVKERKLIGKYKNGNPRYKNVSKKYKPDPLIDPASVFGPDEKMHNSALGWRMDANTLEAIANLDDADPTAQKLAKLILKLRETSKIISTYLQPIKDKMGHRPYSPFSNTVHHQIQQTSTATGRTSSVKPNGQNMPTLVRKLVGVENDWVKVAQWDFDALEMKVAASLCRSGKMLQDVTVGDIHYEVGKRVFGWNSESDMTKEERRIVKNVNFGILYGGRAKGLAKQSGVPENLINQIIANHKQRYPAFHKWQRDVLEEVTALPTDGPPKATADGMRYANVWRSVSGRKYAFYRHPLPWNPSQMAPSPMQTANYPVQGFATGDIVPLFIALVCGILDTPGCFFPINAVHDAFVGVGDETDIKEVNKGVAEIQEDMPLLIKELYNHDFHGQLTLGLDVDDTWS